MTVSNFHFIDCQTHNCIKTIYTFTNKHKNHLVVPPNSSKAVSIFLSCQNATISPLLLILSILKTPWPVVVFNTKLILHISHEIWNSTPCQVQECFYHWPCWFSTNCLKENGKLNIFYQRWNNSSHKTDSCNLHLTDFPTDFVLSTLK